MHLDRSREGKTLFAVISPTYHCLFSPASLGSVSSVICLIVFLIILISADSPVIHHTVSPVIISAFLSSISSFIPSAISSVVSSAISRLMLASSLGYRIGRKRQNGCHPHTFCYHLESLGTRLW